MKRPSVLKRKIFFCLALLTLFLGTGWMAFCQTHLGDVDGNGAIEIIDALIVARHTAGLPISVYIAGNADTNADGLVNIVDALLIVQYTAGILNTLPPSTTPPPTATPTSTPTPTPTSLPEITHLPNAFEGAKWYVNQEWAANASASGGAAVANCNTAIWLDSIGSIAPATGLGLAGHLDACLEQGANLITIVLYNIPARDCASASSSNELSCDVYSTEVERYKTEFVDRIAAILSDPKYYGLRIVTIIEPDSLPHLITNVDSFMKCQEVYQRGCYVMAIQYVLDKLAPLPHVYKYLEIGHSAWLGWPENFSAAVNLYKNVILNTTAGAASIDGFVSNVNFTFPLDEPFIPSGDATIGNQQIKSTVFYEWNPMVDEIQYCDLWYAQMSATFPGMGMLVDTSRNGWGGPNRPAAASTATDVETYVNESRIDRRSHRGNWCNNKYAGLGIRPTANPRPNYDAYVWVNPPGESDGISEAGILDPTDPNKRFDVMCDPNGINIYCNCGYTDARSNMPHQGRWSTEFFRQLLANAYPPVNQ